MKAQFLIFTFLLIALIISPKVGQTQITDTSVWNDKTFENIKFRSIGPAFMAGRIADIAIHPEKESTWYVAVGSGGVWKTDNAGTTWETIFDNESSYSIGCITIDPSQTSTIWVGTGENVGGRHVGYGDGIYKSEDGGATWKNMGLKTSEHISKILVHPDNSDEVLVAAQGPLWSSGGERGLYKTKDGGVTWNRVLGDDKWTGVTDIVMDPMDTDVLYAATWDRHRTVAAYMSGGPGSGIYKSTDGGETWKELTNGLPKSNMGKIGLAVSHQKSNHIYAAIELDRRQGGLYKSTDGGASWSKQSDAVSGATGPHYYQELYASPHQHDRLYLMDVRIQVSEDGGKTFTRLKEEHKHSDNHAIAFKKSDENYLIIGTDGGLYESYDLAENWKFFDNMPITQFYKIAVDDAEPFYNVYGGTQDNSTEGGPSRTDNAQGIQNSDWRVVLNWDGHQPATEPGNPNIVYGQRQEGTLSRIDMATGEVIDIQPQPGAGENYERYNWDAPILVSPHSPKRIYFASQRLWKSDNRGDSWEAISGDLTRNEERLELPIMGKKQSWDNPWDFLAMSNYNTITSIAESPMQQDLIYIGTDDGQIQITEDGGANWRKIMTTSLPGAPERAYVNDIKADLFQADIVYVALSHHKAGDFTPYLYKSEDRGMTWTSMAKTLPERHLVWRLVQDDIDPNLMFIGTEFGVFVTKDGGDSWVEMGGGLPTISFRDLAIQRREDDLVCGSFGRSIYILDDYSFLRNISEADLKDGMHLYPLRDTWWYFPRPHLIFGGKKGAQGAAHFVADNPPFGAQFTYFLSEGLKSKKDIRQDKEKKLDSLADVVFPGWDALADEEMASFPELFLVVKNASGELVRKLSVPTKKGFHRVAWDLRYPSTNAVDLDNPKKPGGNGFMAPPGTYTAQLAKWIDHEFTPMGDVVEFEVKTLFEPTLSQMSMAEVAGFWRSYEKMNGQQQSISKRLDNLSHRIKAIDIALKHANVDNSDYLMELGELSKATNELELQWKGHPSKVQVGEKVKPNVAERMFAIARGVSQSRYGPTASHLELVDIINQEMVNMDEKLDLLNTNAENLSRRIMNDGGPYIEGTRMDQE